MAISAKRNRYSTKLPTGWTSIPLGTPSESEVTTGVSDTSLRDNSSSPTLEPHTHTPTASGTVTPKTAILPKMRYTRKFSSSWVAPPTPSLQSIVDETPPSNSRPERANHERRVANIATGTHNQDSSTSTWAPVAPIAPTFPSDVRAYYQRPQPMVNQTTMGYVHNVPRNNINRDSEKSLSSISPAISLGLSSTYSPSDGRDLPVKAPRVSPAYSIV